MQNIIYMDNAATTRTDKEVLKAMEPYFSDKYSNPSSVYNFAQDNKKEIEKSRKIIAKMINAKPEEIFFTSGGTESDNWAIKGIMEAYKGKGKHMITSKIEHHAVIHSCKYLEKNGYDISYCDVDEYGIVDLKKINSLIKKDTIMISIMAANNEIGTIQKIAQIGKLARDRNIIFHTDAVQALGHIPIDVKLMNIDMLSASAHKFGGPKGIGFLYIREKIAPDSFMHGGSQEEGKRAGTYNVPGIIGIGKAAEIADKNMQKRFYYETKMRDYMIKQVMKKIPYTRLNGHYNMRLPGNMNFSFQFINGEALLFMLDEKGICASAGSACTSNDKSPSHVLVAIGLPEEIAYGSLRFTISHETTMEEINYVVNTLAECIEKLRSYSETYISYVKNV